MTNELSIKLDILSAYMGSSLTDEQKEFASDFTKDTISFSDPGTGKTHTLVAGLIMAQQYHKIPGNLINCMSFTNAAVSEMAGRYEKYAKKCDVAPTVVFNTFHKLSNRIMKRAYPDMKPHDGKLTKDDFDDMKRYMSELGIDSTDNTYVRKVLNAINSMNSALIFHPEHLRTKYDFLVLGMNVEDFQMLRKRWFIRARSMGRIAQGDIPLYCLFALMSNPDIIKEWKGKYKIMVVDEFQDLSLLHLRILSYVAETLIVIGDMKQQIYMFNGACPQIVREYLKLHPNARVSNLTKSFRCGQAISEFATNLIKPNDSSIVPFTGHDRGSSVEIYHRKDIDWASIADNIVSDIQKNGRAKAADIMFLYRNNTSTIPIIEELYKREIPFRCSKYKPIMEIPVFESMSKLVDAAWQPNNVEFAKKALALFPEFRNLPAWEDAPPIAAMKASGKSLFEVHYKYTDPSSRNLLEAMYRAHEAILNKKSAGVVYMKVYEEYNKYIYKNEWWTFDNEKEYYLNLVSPICNSKPYPLLRGEEYDKVTKNQQYIDGRVGIRCYTMHSAKGLEADIVCILDCDEGVFPNASQLDKKIKAGCLYDAAVDIRSERNLLYVAATRAKSKLIITYSGDRVSELISSPDNNQYTKYDSVYTDNNDEYDDAAEFFKLYNISGGSTLQEALLND